MRSAIEKVNWDTVDPDKVVGDYIEMPDGTPHYIEMDMLHWYWLDFMLRHGKSIKGICKAIYTALAEDPEGNFDDCFRAGVFAWGREWVRITEGR